MADNDLCQHHETSDNVGATLVQRDNGKPSKGGAPVGNRNALRIGHRSRRPLPINQLGPEYVAIGQAARVFRKRIESEVTKLHGGVSLAAGAEINLCVRHEIVAQACYLAVRQGRSANVPQDLRLAVDSSTKRNAVLRRLGIISTEPRNEWDQVDELLAQEVAGDQDDQEAAGEADGADDSEPASEGDRTAGDDAGDQAGDTDGDDSSDLWATVDEAIDRQREEDGA